MRIEGVIATTGMVAQQAPAVTDGANQRERAQNAQAPQAALAAAQEGADGPAVGKQMLSEAVNQVSSILNTFDETLAFQVHEETHATMVTVVDKTNGQVIRQFPSEKFLDLVAMFQKQLSGLLVDARR